MTAAVQPAATASLWLRTGALLRDAILGTLLCTGPVTALIALGWIVRRSGHWARARFCSAEEIPGWLLGPREAEGRETGRLARLLGGLAANIRAGVMALAALLAWTLPFSLLWLGAWWAGWENSFNKGYEQAAVGPLVFLLGAVLAAVILPVLPLLLTHLAVEDRLSAAFEVRRLRSLLPQAGWRLPALSLLTLLAALPLAGARGILTTATDTWPWLEDLPPDDIAALQGQITLAFAAFVFFSSWLLRSLSARVYSRAAPRAAGAYPGLWDGSQAAEAAGPASKGLRLLTLLWWALAAAVTLALVFLILSGQFLDHAWWRWVFHPALTLPWAG